MQSNPTTARTLAALLVALLGLATPTPASAWSNKEHIQLTRIAAMRLIAAEDTPAEMKEWLRAATPGLTDMDGERRYFMEQRVGVFPRGADGLAFWATVPDLAGMTDNRADPKIVKPFGVGERLLHYIDVEFFHPDDSRRSYVDDLSHKPSLEDIPRDMTDERYKRAGMLPFRVEQCYEELVKAIRSGKLTDTPGQFPRDEHAAKWAGFLAHYVQDNTQPHHATADYKSATYFKNSPQAPNVHADMEYRLADDEHDDFMELREEFWNLFATALDEVEDPVQTDDLWQATVEVALISYDALPMIGRAAQAAYAGDKPGMVGKFKAETFFHYTGTYQGREMTLMEMKARQMAWAVQRVERLWRRAWDEATTAAGVE